MLVQVLGEAETKIRIRFIEGGGERRELEEAGKAVSLLPVKERQKEGGMGRKGLRWQ